MFNDLGEVYIITSHVKKGLVVIYMQPLVINTLKICKK